MRHSLWIVLLGSTAVAAEPEVRYNRDVRPILTQHCLPCHGRDENARQAELRLDGPEAAMADRGGYSAITPGHPEKSAAWTRIQSHNEEEVMPPPARPRLTAEQKDLLERWIRQGARYEPHWAFVPPKRPAIPAAPDSAWPRNTIDFFVLARLEAEGLAPGPEADKATLLRRVYLDLIGLPPTPEEAEVFLSDESPDAYERLVDRLLDSPHYGEQMALDWLDAARYGDSGGYQGDILRMMWPWRDWVLAAFNSNMPFDQFTIEQLAGDLLPQATREQRIATGFHRNHRINDEDGIILEEFRVEYVADRAETTAAVWLGQTMGCARCHDHKYDPISQQDYYRFFAFFNSIDEQGRGHGNAPPILRLTTPEQDAQLAALDAELAQATAAQQSPENAEEASRVMSRVEELKKQKEALLAAAPTTMVLQDLPAPRKTHILTRGAYDKPSDEVEPGVPEIFPSLPDGAPRNRLALAHWLVDPSNPLTARVIVNRYWQMHLGTGLVATPEDFGVRGELPSRPELLDWLAVEFIESGWDLKALHRLIVTSATWRQSSRGSPEQFRRDPENRLLARGPRFRLPAELLRDQALAAAGLLERRLGGPSVKPYQPDGLWRELNATYPEYEPDQGPDLYRRSIYTFWRRTIAPPAMTALDAPSREFCIVRRPRTNTPIQALVLLNDPTFVEAARALAEQTLRSPAHDDAARLAYAFRRVLVRAPTEIESKVLLELHENLQSRFAARSEDAKELIAVGSSSNSEDIPASLLAAWTGVAAAILNLDESVTRE